MDNPSDRFFVDTGYVLARFNLRDQHHDRAKDLSSLIAAGRELWTTDAVLLNVASAFQRRHTAQLPFRSGMSFTAAICAVDRMLRRVLISSMLWSRSANDPTKHGA
jgi:predicted nucleic acid-binding protein